jgi:phosphate transport system permease protein
MIGPAARARRARPGVSATKALSVVLTGVAVGSLAILFLLLVRDSLPVWRHAGFSGYVAGKRWYFRAEQFGALPMIYGTLAVSAIALALAAPLAIGAALFTAEVLPQRARLPVKVAIELLAGIPSVVYGLLGVLFLRDWVYELLARFDPLSGDTLLTAGLLLGVMVLPTVMTLADDALRGVPRAHRDAARGLGLTRTETIWTVSLPQASSGIVAATLLGLGRALGETIAVFLVVGRQDNQWPEHLLSLRPLVQAGQTLTSKLGGSEINLAYGEPLHWAAMVGLGLVLLVMVVALTLLAALLTRRSADA